MPGRPVPTFIKLESVDVIHSFWVPQLAGKMDVIPNKTNRVWVEPLVPGTYVGQCAEYCGIQHALMLLTVVVHPREEFERWAAAQQAPARDDPATQPGREFFASLACINCHTVRGTTANGIFGPDLTHLMSRSTIGAGAAQNTPERLRAWVDDPAAFKPGALMPAMKLSRDEVDKLTAYLVTLRDEQLARRAPTARPRRSRTATENERGRVAVMSVLVPTAVAARRGPARSSACTRG